MAREEGRDADRDRGSKEQPCELRERRAATGECLIGCCQFCASLPRQAFVAPVQGLCGMPGDGVKQAGFVTRHL